MFELPFKPPVQPLHHPLYEAHGVKVFIQREDYFHPFISGNKWRKLKYVFRDLVATQKKHAVSFGGAYSNHLVALACAGAMYGIKTTAFVRGEEVYNAVLNLCKWYGMQLHFVSREAYRDKRALYQTVANDETYFIDEGGKGDLAVLGCEEILEDVSDVTHVLCAVGTGTTLSGIAKAAQLKNITAEGICVLKGAEVMDDEVATMAGYQVHIHHQFHVGGYAKTTPEYLHFIQQYAAQTGILFDQVYTGKMLWAVHHLIESGYYENGSKLLLIHSGGLLGMMSLFHSASNKTLQ